MPVFVYAKTGCAVCRERGFVPRFLSSVFPIKAFWQKAPFRQNPRYVASVCGVEHVYSFNSTMPGHGTSGKQGAAPFIIEGSS